MKIFFEKKDLKTKMKDSKNERLKKRKIQKKERFKNEKTANELKAAFILPECKVIL